MYAAVTFLAACSNRAQALITRMLGASMAAQLLPDNYFRQSATNRVPSSRNVSAWNFNRKAARLVVLIRRPA
jgi:hypothetical protein